MSANNNIYTEITWRQINCFEESFVSSQVEHSWTQPAQGAFGWPNQSHSAHHSRPTKPETRMMNSQTSWVVCKSWPITRSAEIFEDSFWEGGGQSKLCKNCYQVTVSWTGVQKSENAGFGSLCCNQNVLQPLLCTWWAKWAEWPPKVMKRSERWNAHRICQSWDSNSDGSDLWSDALPVRPRRSPKVKYDQYTISFDTHYLLRNNFFWYPPIIKWLMIQPGKNSQSQVRDIRVKLASCPIGLPEYKQKRIYFALNIQAW